MQTPAETAGGDRRQLRGQGVPHQDRHPVRDAWRLCLKCTSLSPNTGPSAPTQPPVQSATKRRLQRLDCPPYPRPRPSSSPRSSIRILTAGSFEFGADAVLSDQQIGGAPDVDFGCHRRVRGRGWRHHITRSKRSTQGPGSVTFSIAESVPNQWHALQPEPAVIGSPRQTRRSRRWS